MKLETKIDWLFFLIAAVLGILGFLTRQRLDRQFEDLVPRKNIAESGPIGSLFDEVMGEGRK